MLILKNAALIVGALLVAIGLLAMAADVVSRLRQRRRRSRGLDATIGPPTPLGSVLGVCAIGLALTVVGGSLAIVPAGKGGVRVSQFSGTRPGTLGAGVHLIKPLLEEVVLYDLREHVLNTEVSADPRARADVLFAQSREGLAVGLAVSVRYKLDPQRLDSIHQSLGPAVATEIVPAVVTSAFRQIVPNYLVREVFATKRDEVRQKAGEIITAQLATDGVLVREVMLRDILLPAEFAKGLEALLLKEQENERMVFELQVKEKLVRSAELEAEAQKAREVKAAEGHARVRVLQAKAEADAMQHTLPLKEKQIEQSRLEAEARKAATLMNAEAAGQAKVIDSKAELERLNRMADAEAHRIRTTSEAELERMKVEASLLRENPLLIQKIVAERLSDKMQIMMVPMDGRNFFANEVFRSAAGMFDAPSREDAAPAVSASRRATSTKK